VRAGNAVLQLFSAGDILLWKKREKRVYRLNMKRGDISGKHKCAFRIYPLLSDGRCNYPSKKVRKYLLTFL